MRKSREGIGRLGAVLSLCLALALSGIPVSAEPKAGTEKTETEKMPDDFLEKILDRARMHIAGLK